MSTRYPSLKRKSTFIYHHSQANLEKMFSKFIMKMKIAVIANQIAENNKIEGLKKHLRASALNTLGENESYESRFPMHPHCGKV